MATRKPKTSIDDYKDRMTAPISVVVTTPKGRKPKTTKRKGK